MTIQIHGGEIYQVAMRTRMPFRYGIATLTHLPHAFVRLRVTVDGREIAGIAADHLPPKWFTKDPNRPPEDEIPEMVHVIRHALQVAEGLSGDTPFALWRQVYAAQDAWAKTQQLAPLLAHFGTSLVERALIEAVCRVRETPFAALLHSDALGIRLGEIHPALDGKTPADLLPAQPLERILVRHTVGLSDPLTDADIAPGERLDDGLPQSLTACIEAYGLRHFKIKLNGDLDRDVDRLQRVADVITARAPADYAFSLDGNEQYKALADFRAFWEAVQGISTLRPFLGHLLFVEQPLHRDVALAPEVAEGFAAWPDRPPVIIDESDATTASLPAALALGYAGTSHKNCKGVFKGVANACLLRHLSGTQPDRRWVMSGEDLSNVGPVALPQDLAVMASVGIESVERNGQHYFAGLSMFGPDVQQQTLAAHGDLYHEGARGWPTLTIERGEIALGTVNAAPFGVGFALDVSAFERVA